MWKCLMVLAAGVLATEADLSSQQDLVEWTRLQADMPSETDEGRFKRTLDKSNLMDEWDKDISDNFIQDADHTYSKRFINIFKSRPPKSEGYKRGPGFRSWGGKRSDQQILKKDSEYPEPYEQHVKRKILAQGGSKRRPFQSWGGKRAYKYPLYLIRENVNEPIIEAKRKFNSWGGKRASFEENEINKQTHDEVAEEKRSGNRRKPSFQSWGGKRFSNLDFY